MFKSHRFPEPLHVAASEGACLLPLLVCLVESSRAWESCVAAGGMLPPQRWRRRLFRISGQEAREPCLAFAHSHHPHLVCSAQLYWHPPQWVYLQSSALVSAIACLGAVTEFGLCTIDTAKVPDASIDMPVDVPDHHQAQPTQRKESTPQPLCDSSAHGLEQFSVGTFFVYLCLSCILG